MTSNHYKRYFKYFLLLISLSFGFQKTSYGQADAIPTESDVITAGATLFRQNCFACHRIQEDLIGPGLANVYDRRDVAWIQSFVKNSQKVIQSGDDYAVNLYNQYSKTLMTSFDFNDDEILSILAYIKDQTDNPPVEVAATGATGGVEAGQGGMPTIYINIILGGLVLTLLLLILVLVMISSIMQRFLRQRGELDSSEEELVAQRFDFLAIFRNRAFFGIVAFVITAIVFKGLIDELYNIGVQQGYAPKQPIAFSHKVHAGQFEIDCNYCHTGVTKSKNANIPSPNLRMNCHSSITKGTNTGTTEIAKIYEAIENDKPIEWVRIHNLPDLAYFNHAQHVNIGKLECAACHGPIEEMEVVRQYANLTMGWCINCHRTTEIKTRDNGYYDKLVEFHDSPDPMKVEDIGGLECAKCHY